ncbi:proteinaceous RNase P 1, chloroplastic/mitochondrial-like [Quillaja saponaria]|uniref:Proteinaceous RNase P 1, chloroplastic/mitochondrial-like n=1 Tax=Quillaja saponaria TaxID=32244 RepID=A0AAD7VFE5_QUISA|nr:proteinaceous RNase P 1, chloroplastic/mitochondrial-like [Quillaja saponaria]
MEKGVLEVGDGRCRRLRWMRLACAVHVVRSLLALILTRKRLNFATSLTRLVCQREVKADFNQFQEWLQQQGSFVDGANVGLVNQHNFSFFQLLTAVKQLRQMNPSKRLPLIILHRGCVTGGPALNPNSKKQLEGWEKAGALSSTPHGSNDDRYWLYAAVSCEYLLVTNDEMRDHLFQLLGTNFFPRWKEKDQVWLSVSFKMWTFSPRASPLFNSYSGIGQCVDGVRKTLTHLHGCTMRHMTPAHQDISTNYPTAQFPSAVDGSIDL